MQPFLPWLVVPAAWLLGGVSPGYWLVRLRTGADVRTQGSGATGATNASRVLGGGGFALVLLLDAIKGAIAAFRRQVRGARRRLGICRGSRRRRRPCVACATGFPGRPGFGPLLGAWLVLARSRLAVASCWRRGVGPAPEKGLLRARRRPAPAGGDLARDPQPRRSRLHGGGVCHHHLCPPRTFLLAVRPSGSSVTRSSPS